MKELLHFQELAALALPRKDELPKLPNIDYFASTEPYKGCVGGDYFTFLNFDAYNLQERIRTAETDGKHPLAKNLRKNLDSFGIAVIDVAGHKITDNLIAVMLGAKLEIGFGYELTYNGEVTRGLFERTNTDLHHYINHAADGHPVAVLPYATLIYGEVHNDGRFRYLSAGHPSPLVFSRESGTIQRLDDDRTRTSTALGVIPSKYHVNGRHFRLPPAKTKHKYPVNEIHLLGKGDIMLLYTDGLTEMDDGKFNFCDTGLEKVLRETRDGTAREVYDAIMAGVKSSAELTDDLTLAVIKKTS